MAKLKTVAIAVLGWALISSSAFGYYHYLHYTSRNAPFVAIPEKFDLNALPNKTVSVFVSDAGPQPLQPGDSFAAVLSEIRMAIATWDAVDTSDLRLTFGGLNSAGTPQSTPAIQVMFDEVPPGLLAYTSNTHGDMTSGPNGQFVPITGSFVVLKRDLGQRASSAEPFFLTVVHELGHALGLQHTMSSSVMSTELTRATTKAKPLAADDIAGVSLLYPTQNFASRFGAISGRVTLSGSGVALASVVAISPNGPAVSALTNPDGAYRIDGLQPGSYLIYAHALPPNFQPGLGPADIQLPVDSTGRAFPAGSLFQTQFYPGTGNWQQAIPVPVTTGVSTDGINFSVQARSSLPVYDVTTYSYPGSFAVKPAYLTNFSSRKYFVAAGTGLISSSGTPVAGLGVNVVGGLPVSGIRPYTPTFMIVDLDFNPFSGDGPRHLVFSLNNDFYILPSGVTLTGTAPPAITSVIPGIDPTGARTVTITGSNFTRTTRIYFDGLPATIRTIDDGNGVIVATPPPGGSSYQATVTALNSDGQSSLFTNPPFTYGYEPADPPSVIVTPNTLPAGTEAMIDITGVNTNFVDGRTTLGLGSSDITVKRLFVLSPNHLLATVSISPNAPSLPTEVSIISGFQVINQPFAFFIQPSNPRVPVLNSQLINPATGQPSVYAGGMAVMLVTNLPASASPSNLQLTVGGVNTPILAASAGQITFQIPSGLPTGAAIVRLQNGVDAIQPVVVAIDALPPSILAINSATNTLIDASRPAHPGDFVNVLVANLADPGTDIAPSRVHLLVGGIDHTALQNPQSLGSAYLVQFMLAPTIPTTGGQVSVTLSIDSRTSQPYLLPIRSF